MYSSVDNEVVLRVAAFVRFEEVHQDGAFERVDLADVFLGALVVIPEGGIAHLGLKRLYFAKLLFAVKETSIDARRAS